MPVRRCSSSGVEPAAEGLVQVGQAALARACARSRASSSSERPLARLSQPSRPSSSERSAFWNASRKVRPMAITSPTDCMVVPSRSGVPGNFSKAQRGTLTTV